MSCPASSKLEELAYPVCIDQAAPLLAPQFFEYLAVPPGPPGIWAEGGYVLGPGLSAIIQPRCIRLFSTIL